MKLKSSNLFDLKEQSYKYNWPSSKLFHQVWKSVRVSCWPLGAVTRLRCCERRLRGEKSFHWPAPSRSGHQLLGHPGPWKGRLGAMNLFHRFNLSNINFFVFFAYNWSFWCLMSILRNPTPSVLESKFHPWCQKQKHRICLCVCGGGEVLRLWCDPHSVRRWLAWKCYLVPWPRTLSIGDH